MIQMDVRPEDPEGNLDRALSALETLPEDTDMACLPEMFVSGFDYTLIRRQSSFLEKEVLPALSGAARKKGLWLVGGSIPEREGALLYNTAVLINPKGEIAGCYRKIHLFPLMGEDEFFTPGTDLPVFETPLGIIGIQLCYDLRFPEVTRALMLRGAVLIFQPAQFPHPRLRHWQILTQARSVENQVFFAAVNRVGEDPLGKFFGHSILLDPWGNPVVEAGEAPGAFVGEVDFGLVDKVRNKIPCLKGRRGDVYGDLEPFQPSVL